MLIYIIICTAEIVSHPVLLIPEFGILVPRPSHPSVVACTTMQKCWGGRPGYKAPNNWGSSIYVQQSI